MKYTKPDAYVGFDVEYVQTPDEFTYISYQLFFYEDEIPHFVPSIGKQPKFSDISDRY